MSRTYSIIFLMLLPCMSAFSQKLSEAKIREMENLESEAILHRDTSAMNQIWSDGLLVNSPGNNVVDKNGGMFALKNGLIHYSSFTKDIERILIVENFGIVMGLETVKPVDKAPNAGKTVKRRYTSIWQQRNNKVSLIARQATNISVE